MRLNISLKFLTTDGFPIHYHYWLQSAIYHVMEGEIANKVHTQGFEGDGRIFRLFTFSKLLGRYELSKDKKFIRFPEGVNWIVSSPLNSILGSIAGGLLKQQTLRMGGTSADITGIQISHPKVQSEIIRVRTISPVVAYSTMFRGDGSKYTVYLQPGEPEFRRIVAENLLKKWEGIRIWKRAGETEQLEIGHSKQIGEVAIKEQKELTEQTAYTEKLEQSEDINHINQTVDGSKSKETNLNIRMINSPRLHILEYKGGITKGYSGMMDLSGPPPLLQVAIDAGLGSKNAQGCGCLEVLGKG